MTNAEALAKIRKLAAGNHIVLSAHALDRMSERGAVYRDVWFALKNAVSTHQQRSDTWLTNGVDCDGDDIKIVLVIEAQLLIVTLF